jgi:predicted DCC family thiol-disulfide oxidoreductase YuxK
VTSQSADDSPLLLFDGQCNLCNAWVQFVLARESRALLKFASLTSEMGQTVLKRHGLPTETLNTLVLVVDGKAFVRSDAALRVTAYLRRPWSWAQVGLWIPRFLRDGCYRIIARWRYRLFGRSAHCRVPTNVDPSRFVSE